MDAETRKGKQHQRTDEEAIESQREVRNGLHLFAEVDHHDKDGIEIIGEIASVLCYEAMKAYLPNAIVKEFGKNSEYTGNAREKIMRLAEDIGLTTDDYEIQQIGERNIQERGLDIVGWLPFKDNCSNLMIFLGQCACGKQFESKQHDVRRFKHYYHFYRTEPQYTFFIPYSLINPSERKFYHSDLIEDDYLIFERMRILSLLKGNDSAYNNLNTKLLVEACIKYPTPNVQ